VFYRPSIREYGLGMMHAPEGTHIVDDKYVIYEGYDHPAGGIY
jgi:hypothetical protein